MVTSKIVKISKNKTRQLRSAKYLAAKDKLMKLFIARASCDEISEKLGVNRDTALKWRNWLIEEEGDLINQKVYRTKIKYIATTLNEIEFVKEKVIKSLMANCEDPKSVMGLSNALTGIQKNELEILSRFNIIAPESVDVHHFAGEGIEVIFLDENKTKIIEMEEKE